MSRRHSLLIPILLAATVGACGFHHEKGSAGRTVDDGGGPVQNPSVDQGATTPPEPGDIGMIRPVSWATLKQQVIAPRCLSCHSVNTRASGGVKLDEAAEARDSAAMIFNMVVVEKTMPKRAPALPAREMDLLSAWMIDGMRD